MQQNNPRNRAQKARIAEKQARKVAEAMAAPTAEKVVDMASRLGRKELLAALEGVADKVGPIDAVKHLHALLPDPVKQMPDVPKTLPAEVVGAAPKPIGSAKKEFPSTPDSRLAVVYGRPFNQRQRLIEFKDDGTHGVLWVQYDSPVWVGWTVWAKRNPNEQQKGWVLDGKYSRRGIRLA